MRYDAEKGKYECKEGDRVVFTAEGDWYGKHGTIVSKSPFGKLSVQFDGETFCSYAGVSSFDLEEDVHDDGDY